MEYKRGLSSIVTTVLIIFVSLAAVTAIAVIIKPIAEDGIRNSPTAQEVCINDPIEIKSCQRVNISQGDGTYVPGYNIAYLRKEADKENAPLIQIKASVSSGQDILNSNRGLIPKVGETATIQIPTSNVYDKSEILAGYFIEAKERVVSCTPDPIQCDNALVLSEKINYTLDSSYSVCGNNIIEGIESCELNLFNSQCSNYETGKNTLNFLNPGNNYISGNVKCNNCALNFSSCIQEDNLCGNGAIDEGEVCDGGLIDYNSCTDHLISSNQSNPDLCPGPLCFDSGNVKCSSDCKKDLSECVSNHQYPGCFGIYQYNAANGPAVCANIDNQQQCEQFNNWDNNCIWNVTEQHCQGPYLTCQAMKNANSCNALEGCGWIEQPSCGNGELNYDEECDANQFFFYEAGTEGYYTFIGDLVPFLYNNTFFEKTYAGLSSGEYVQCNSCKMIPACGDGIVQEFEDCEASIPLDVDQSSCSFLWHGTGTVTCNPYLCSYDFSGCID